MYIFIVYFQKSVSIQQRTSPRVFFTMTFHFKNCNAWIPYLQPNPRRHTSQLHVNTCKGSAYMNGLQNTFLPVAVICCKPLKCTMKTSSFRQS